VEDKQEQDRRAELEKDQVEDLEVKGDDAEQVKGGTPVSKAKTADKQFQATSDFIKG
jgi:hypothetical protein